MKIQDLLRSPDHLDTELTDISVLIPESALGHLQIALESHWIPAQNGLMYRIDAANPAIPLLRHVHIAKKQHTAAKNMQASWNVDGTKHDRKSFNDKVAKQNAVRELAREVLKLDWTISLESDGALLQTGSIVGDTPTFSADGTEAYIRFTQASIRPKVFDW
jgi:hypothetical protein